MNLIKMPFSREAEFRAFTIIMFEILGQKKNLLQTSNIDFKKNSMLSTDLVNVLLVSKFKISFVTYCSIIPKLFQSSFFLFLKNSNRHKFSQTITNSTNPLGRLITCNKLRNIDRVWMKHLSKQKINFPEKSFFQRRN